MIFIDEQRNKIGDENSEPDWSAWTSEYTEEFTAEDGDIDVYVICRKLSQNEINESKSHISYEELVQAQKDSDQAICELYEMMVS